MYISILYAQYTPIDSQTSYICDNSDWLLVPKSVDFVQTLSEELYAKTGYFLCVAVINKLPQSKEQKPQNSTQAALAKLSRDEYRNNLTKHLPKPYTLIYFMKDSQKMGIISSEPRTYLDEDKIYFEYMVPLLPKTKNDELTPQLISAIVLNGYASAADMIAKHFNVALQNNMPLDESGGREFVRFSMYAMLLIMFAIIGALYLTRKSKT
ncbi:hypothetical protein [Helicobacter marmotae]|uniref:hypothetical protein n=1 Tax=Helicobacter marmotae TaxID=152490 RepID=UPI001F3E4D2E|nr:hypothetical protein [Helicobacter marmotae]